jgi:pimeloyl-ACP methyl ester carboxylesterase
MSPVYDVLTTPDPCVHDVLNTRAVYDVLTIDTYGADIEALLQREACKPPIYASKATCRGFFRLDFTERLAEVRVPTLILCGNEDKPVPLETASKVLAEKIPDARLVVVQDTGHFPHMEKPEIVNEAIWKWLEEKISQEANAG